jgi:pyrimidine-nucleoside phosphorylase
MKAHEYFMRMIAIQAGDWEGSKEKYRNIATTPLLASRDGAIQSIKTREIGIAAIELGAGRKQQSDEIDHSAGFIFLKKVGDEVRKGEEVVLIQANNTNRFDVVKEMLSRCIEIGNDSPRQLPMILEEW